MKKIKVILLTTVTLAMVGLQTSCTDYQDEIDALDYRVTVLENLVSRINTELESLQTAIRAFGDGDYITNVTETNDGYIITFAKNGAVIIKDGKNGKDAETPDISIAQNPTDGNYYWTLNGTWLLDGNGNKINATGKKGADGKDGVNGKDGKDGIDGKDGKDGVDGRDGVNGKDGRDGRDGIALAPQVRINEYTGIWEISYDGGSTWIPTGTSARPINGVDGKNGTNGKDGNTTIVSVQFWTDQNTGIRYVRFNLANGYFDVPIS